MLNIVRYNLNALRTFVIVADAGSFSKAANRLAVTQGAVSQQIARLEEYLGTPLFERLPKNLQLTPQGLRLLRGVQSSIERIDGVVESARSHRTHEVLSVSSLASYAAKRLAPRLPTLSDSTQAFASNARPLPPSSISARWSLILQSARRTVWLRGRDCSRLNSTKIGSTR